ncbi:MAG TPA: hypothetical protein VFW91_16005, partial [Candidatus Binatia bacterium]|nr:hypothetical protein [Candidatus Binatia bacterium]
MKAFLPLTLAMLMGFSLLHADTDKEALGKLTARIEDKFWSLPRRGWCGPRSTEKARARATR